MARFWAVAGFLLGLAGQSALAEEATYRLSGIAGPADDLKMLIELPDGTQRWLARGDRLGDGEILEIAHDRVRLRLPDGERVIRPTFGRPFSLLGGAGASEQGGGAALEVGTRRITEDRLSKLVQLATRTSSGGLGANINKILKLPPDSRIHTISGFEITSERAALTEILEALGKKLTPHLLYMSGAGDGEVYLLPEETATAQ